MEDDRNAQLFGMGIGAIGPIAVAGLLVGIRGEIINANVALVLVVVVLVAAITGGRAGGAVGAISSTLSFDFFHTRPYGSLTINSANDAETAALLLVVGLAVGEIAARARRSAQQAARGRRDLDRIHRVAELSARGAAPDSIVEAVREELVRTLALRDCQFEPPPFGIPLPRLERSGVVLSAEHRFSRGAFELPAEGVELPVLGRGQPVGRFLLEPTPGQGVTLEQRIVAVALSDQLGVVLAPVPDPSEQT